MAEDEKKKNDGGAREVKELTLEDLKRVRGGLVDVEETALDDYNRDRCYKKCSAEIA